jgi:hypothetical protein
MNATNKQQIVEATKAYLIKRTDVNQSDLAKTIGYGPAAISQVLSGTYAGDDSKILLLLAKEVGFEIGQKWLVRRTGNFNAIQNICNEAQEEHRMMAICGNTGLGKTTALEYYRRHTGNTFYVLSDVLMKPKDMLRAIMRSMGIEMDGSLSEMLNRIIDKGLEIENLLLVIDDSGKLMEHPKCYFIIQLIYDRWEGHSGIVLAGMPVFREFMKKMVLKGKNGFPELARRISHWEFLKPMESAFVSAAAADYGITDTNAVKLIAERCTNYGDVKNMLINYSAGSDKREAGAESQREILAGLHINFIH